MLAAFTERDRNYDGAFVAAVRTTGIFCRSSCPARRPHPEHVEFLESADKALAAGYRPCLRCRPLETNGTAPAWLDPLLAALERDPRRRWTDADLARPEAVRRWFRRRFGRTFHDRPHPAAGGSGRHPAARRTGDRRCLRPRLRIAQRIREPIGTSPRATGDARLLAVTPVETPLGVMLLGAAEGKLCLAEFSDPARMEAQLRRVRRRLAATLVPGLTPHRSLRSTLPAVGASICPCCRPAPYAAAGMGDAAADPLWRDLDLRPGSGSDRPPAPGRWARPSAPTPSPSSSPATG